jgi:hypothetical protein
MSTRTAKWQNIAGSKKLFNGNLTNSCDVPAHGGQDFIPIAMSALPLTTH